MSVEVSKPVEETPVSKSVEATQPEVVDPVAPAVAPEAATTEAAAEGTTETVKTADDKVIVEATPASEGELGYKAPGFMKQFVFSKHYFWLSEEAATSESLKTYLQHEKAETAHNHAAWAQETSTGVLYYAKRAEDKAHPLGLILLADAHNVVKEGSKEFSFIVNKKSHRFEAATSEKRDSWIVAIEKQVKESKDIQEEVTGRESYKKTLEGFAAAPVAAVAKTERSRSKKAEKALETPAATTEPAAKEEDAVVAPVVASPEKEKTEKATKKERSQSRKRNSVFDIFKKDEDKEAKKDAEKAEKEVKKAEAEQVKVDKKGEAETKKDEAKETHDAATAVEAVEAAAIAAAPAGAVAALENKKEEKHAKEAEAETVSPTEKQKKRSSVFGFLSSKKVASPAAEKSEKEAAAPADTTDIPPVSETAPKLDEPIDTKPIDAAAVTAPVDTVTTPAPVAEAEAPASEVPATTAETPTKTEKKGSIFSVFKKSEAKKEAKEEAEEKKVTEPASTDAAPVVATDGVTEAAATETPAVEAGKEERPAREKRRSSFFSSLGTIKKKTATTEGTETEGAAASDVKREKSPLPGKIGGFLRKSSKTAKPAETEAAAAEVDTPKAETGAVEAPAAEVAATEAPVATVHDATTVAPAEVKASA